MTQEKKQEFTRRLTQSNRTGVILITYEIIFTYLNDAKVLLREVNERQKELSEEDRESYKDAIRKAQEMIRSLCQALNFQYDISKNLYAIYALNIRELALAMSSQKIEKIEEVEGRMQKLYKSFLEVAKADHSEILMKNAQTVYAGMTYGKNNMAETYMEVDRQRGYFA